MCKFTGLFYIYNLKKLIVKFIITTGRVHHTQTSIFLSADNIANFNVNENAHSKLTTECPSTDTRIFRYSVYQFLFQNDHNHVLRFSNLYYINYFLKTLTMIILLTLYWLTFYDYSFHCVEITMNSTFHFITLHVHNVFCLPVLFSSPLTSE